VEKKSRGATSRDGEERRLGQRNFEGMG